VEREEGVTTLLGIFLAFLSGSIPFSVWIGRLALGKDIQQYGDGNPGGSNVVRAGSKFWGAAAIVLDFLKGAIPVGTAHYIVGLEGWSLAAVALAPIVGHAFSPFLNFRGGKALAVTFGIWCGLSLWLIPTLLGISFAFWLKTTKVSGLAVMLGLLTLLPAFFLLDSPKIWFAIWAGNALILGWKHRHDLRYLLSITR
jgi:glycerol-3-phosphate acyltransferase PlsY